MASLLGKFVAGAATGLAQGIMAQAEAKRQQALLDLERQYRRDDARFEAGLRDASADRQALTRAAADELQYSRSQDEITGEPIKTKTGGLLSRTKSGKLIPSTLPEGTELAAEAEDAEPLEDIWDPEKQVIVKKPRSQAAGLLSAANKPPAPGKPDRESPRDELIRKIMAVGLKGLSAEEREALEQLDRSDPFRQAMAAMLGGGAAAAAGGGGPFADDGMGPGGTPKPGGSEKPKGAIDIPAESSEVLSAPDGSIVEDDSASPPKRYRKQGKYLVPVQ